MVEAGENVLAADQLDLGDLQRQPFGGHVVLVEQRGDLRGEPGLGEHTQGDVDRDRQCAAGLSPLPRPAQPFAEHDLVEYRELAGVLGDGYEVLRRYGPVDRVVPAGKALDAHQAAITQCHLGLEVDLQLARPQRHSQVTGEPEPAHRARLEPGIEQLNHATPLGRVGCHVGALQQNLRLMAVIRIHGHTHVGVDVNGERLDNHAVA